MKGIKMSKVYLVFKVYEEQKEILIFDEFQNRTLAIEHAATVNEDNVRVMSLSIFYKRYQKVFYKIKKQTNEKE